MRGLIPCWRRTHEPRSNRTDARDGVAADRARRISHPVGYRHSRPWLDDLRSVGALEGGEQGRPRHPAQLRRTLVAAAEWVRDRGFTIRVCSAAASLGIAGSGPGESGRATGIVRDSDPGSAVGSGWRWEPRADSDEGTVLVSHALGIRERRERLLCACSYHNRAWGGGDGLH